MKQIYMNGNVMTMDDSNPRCHAFAVENGIFTEVGDYKSVLEACENSEYIITNLNGRTVVPGFNDSHMHLLNFAYSLTKINLEGINSIEEILDAGKRHIEKNHILPGAWVLGRGWNHYFFKDPRMLNRMDLDQISMEHPILFTRICEHTVAVNTKALECLGIGDATPNPEGGEIERDGDGKATGVLRETARYLAYAVQPPKSVDEIKSMLVRAMEIISSYGVTSVQTDDFETFSDKDWRKVLMAYEELREEGRLKVRVYEQCLLPAMTRLEEFISEGYHTGWGDSMVKVGPLKLLVDGSLGPRSALLSEPYSDAPETCGIGVFTPGELNELLRTAHENHMQLACHGIGDQAIRMILDGFEAAQLARPDGDARMGIVHVQVGDDEIYRRMKENKILGLVQPVFVQADMHCAKERLGEKRLEQSYKYKSMREMGIRTAMSSDAPIESPNPIDGIYVAATRMDYNHYPTGGWYPQEKMEVEDVIRGYTLDSAFAQFEEQKKGSITPGKYADFLILSDDITTVDPEDIRKVKVMQTYLGGKLM